MLFISFELAGEGAQVCCFKFATQEALANMSNCNLGILQYQTQSPRADSENGASFPCKIVLCRRDLHTLSAIYLICELFIIKEKSSFITNWII